MLFETFVTLCCYLFLENGPFHFIGFWDFPDAPFHPQGYEMFPSFLKLINACLGFYQYKAFDNLKLSLLNYVFCVHLNYIYKTVYKTIFDECLISETLSF